MKQDLFQYLKQKRYPGRGILLGRSPDGENGVIAYFIMGRSANSRNRVLEETNDGARTKAYDESKMEDPSLIIYNAVAKLGDGRTVVSNGDQTDSVRSAAAAGWTAQQALAARRFEPDDPNWTPRITGVLSPDGSYMLSIIRALDGDPSCCCRAYFEYENPPAGAGQFICTYQDDGSPLPSFTGEPLYVNLPQTGPQELAEALWDSLNEDNRVSVYAAFVNLSTREMKAFIVNGNYLKEAAEKAAAEAESAADNASAAADGPAPAAEETVDG
ncbi:MAG: inosine monophosphate cyclohydrolase [Clostridia bacterium]|nr:inosine monophosphate cyclohydrolase [Clostridia bacterium]